MKSNNSDQNNRDNGDHSHLGTGQKSKLPLWVIVSLVISCGLALLCCLQRFRLEHSNRAVSISAEYEVIQSLALAQGESVPQALTSLKADGLRSVVLSEEGFSDLVAQGRISVFSFAENAGANAAAYATISGTPADVNRVVVALKQRFPAIQVQDSPVSVDKTPSNTESVTIPPLGASSLKNLSLGLNPESAATVKSAGLGIICRFQNPIGLSSSTLNAELVAAGKLGSEAFLPEGNEVLGYKQELKDLVATLTSLHMTYAAPEFAKIAGDLEVMGMAPELVVRLHAAQLAELDRMSYGAAVERYTRAARERGMRYLLLRPLEGASEKPLNSFGDFVRGVARGVEGFGFSLGKPHSYPTDPAIPKLLFVLVGVSAVPVAFFVGIQLDWTGERSRRFQQIAIALAAISLVLGLACYSPSLRHYDTLWIALIYPIAAFQVLILEDSSSPVWNGLRTILIGLVAGLMIAALLANLTYMVQAKQFEGIKLAVFFPILVSGILLFQRYGDPKQALKTAITWNSAIIFLVIVVALAIMAIRTGNDNPAAVSDTELKIRNVLDKVLFVRPRTKSFLVGIPALIVGCQMLALAVKARLPRGHSFYGWTVFILTIGAIGETDVVNTLCHIHSPVLLAVQRIAVGLIVGSIIGSVIWVILKTLLIPRLLPTPSVGETAD